MYKLVDKTGRPLVERHEVMEKMRNNFQELAQEKTIVFEEKYSIIFDVRDEEIKDRTYIGIKKIIDTFKKHKTPVTDGMTTKLIQKAGPTLWNIIYKLIKQVWEKEKIPTDGRTGLIFLVQKKM